MFTVARSGAVSDMYSGDAPPCLIMHKYGECATKEISCLWLELLFASPACFFWLSLRCHGLHWTFLYSRSELLPRRIDLQWDLLGRASPLCYDRLQGWEGVWRQTELSAQITEHQKQNLWTFQSVPSTAAPPRGKDPRLPPVHYNPVRASWSDDAASKNRNNVQREQSGHAETALCFYRALNSFPLLSDSI